MGRKNGSSVVPLLCSLLPQGGQIGPVLTPSHCLPPTYPLWQLSETARDTEMESLSLQEAMALVLGPDIVPPTWTTLSPLNDFSCPLFFLPRPHLWPSLAPLAGQVSGQS